MISFIRGTLVGSDSESALIEVNGIGYRVAMSYHALSSLGSKGDEVLVLTYLYVREDALVLYGFVDEEERSLFERLITCLLYTSDRAIERKGRDDRIHAMSLLETRVDHR